MRQNICYYSKDQQYSVASSTLRTPSADKCGYSLKKQCGCTDEFEELLYCADPEKPYCQIENDVAPGENTNYHDVDFFGNNQPLTGNNIAEQEMFGRCVAVRPAKIQYSIRGFDLQNLPAPCNTLNDNEFKMCAYRRCGDWVEKPESEFEETLNSGSQMYNDYQNCVHSIWDTTKCFRPPIHSPRYARLEEDFYQCVAAKQCPKPENYTSGDNEYCKCLGTGLLNVGENSTLFDMVDPSGRYNYKRCNLEQENLLDEGVNEDPFCDNGFAARINTHCANGATDPAPTCPEAHIRYESCLHESQRDCEKLKPVSVLHNPFPHQWQDSNGSYHGAINPSENQELWS